MRLTSLRFRSITLVQGRCDRATIELDELVKSLADLRRHVNESEAELARVSSTAPREPHDAPLDRHGRGVSREEEIEIQRILNRDTRLGLQENPSSGDIDRVTEDKRVVVLRGDTYPNERSH